MQKRILFVIAGFVLSFFCANAFAEYLSSPLSLEINLKEKEYLPGESLKGSINVTNSSPRSFQSIFIIRMYQNEKRYYSFETQIPNIPPGTTRYDFQAFGIRPIDDRSYLAGAWKLVIVQKDLEDQVKADVAFKVKKPKRDY